MKWNDRLLLLIIWAFLALPSLAEQNQRVARQYNFRAYTDGLPQKQVKAVQQDSQGYIWTGSYAGLTRYNGDEFITYSDLLPDHSVTSLTNGHLGAIIVTTLSGFCVLDNGKLDCIDSHEWSPITYLHDSFSARDGSLWFAAEGGVAHYRAGEALVFTQSEGLPSPTVFSVLQDRRGVIWAGTQKGLARLKGDSFEIFASEVLGDAVVKSLLDTKEGIWLGTDRGLYLLSHTGDDITKRSNGEFKDKVILELFKSKTGIIWIGTNAGLFRRSNGFIEKLSPQRNLNSVTIYSITEDREGSLWIGSDDGLIKYVPGPFVSYTTAQGMSNNFVRSISVDKQGLVWMGTRYGVSIFNPKNESFRSITNELESEQIQIYAIKNLPDEGVLIGTRAGMIYWRNNKFIKRFSINDGLPSLDITAFFVDSKKRIWIGTSRGLSRWDNGAILPVVQKSLPITYIEEDNNGNLWLGTRNQGIVIFKPESEEYLTLNHIPELNKIIIWCMSKDRQGNMWVGTNGNGLVKIGPDLKLLEVFDRHAGLGNDYVWQVKVDSGGRVWAYTNMGLKRYENNTFTHFDRADGLPVSEGAATAVVEHPNGDMWFGTSLGVARYLPGEELLGEHPPMVNIETVSVGDKNLEDYSSLPHDAKSMLVRFSSLSFQDERDIKFSYRLIGINDEWSDPQDIRRLLFAKLSPGDYELQIKALKSDRISSIQPATFHFTIQPPFWSTLWFISLSSAMFLFGVWIFVQYRIRSLGKEKKYLEVLVAERTSDLRETNKELNRLVITDELTNLYNRRHLMQRFQQEVFHSSRCSKNCELSFILIDVDHFKAINDNYGHTIGDDVLYALAQRILYCCRKTDIAARYGGEEFAVVLPNTDHTGARTYAEKIKSEIVSSRFELKEDAWLEVTVSIGVVTADTQSKEVGEFDCDKIFKKADAALYRAKKQGRNQVCVYDSKIDTDSG